MWYDYRGHTVLVRWDTKINAWRFVIRAGLSHDPMLDESDRTPHTTELHALMAARSQIDNRLLVSA